METGMDHLRATHPSVYQDYVHDEESLLFVYCNIATSLFKNLYAQVMELLEVSKVNHATIAIEDRLVREWFAVATALDFNEGEMQRNMRHYNLEVSERNEKKLASQLFKIYQRFPSSFSKRARLIRLILAMRTSLESYIITEYEKTFANWSWERRATIPDFKTDFVRLQSIILVLGSHCTSLEVKKCLYRWYPLDVPAIFSAQKAKPLSTFVMLFWYVLSKSPDFVRVEGFHRDNDFENWTREQELALGKKTKHPGPEHERYVRITRHFEERLRNADSAQEYGALVNEVAAILQEPE